MLLTRAQADTVIAFGNWLMGNYNPGVYDTTFKVKAVAQTSSLVTVKMWQPVVNGMPVMNWQLEVKKIPTVETYTSLDDFIMWYSFVTE